jgi:phosphatidylserine/phosphatidylglycerophosphate/cardiolipin synthase-like enzyme
MTGPQYREMEGSNYYSPPVLTVPIPHGQCRADVTPRWFVCDSEYHPHLATYRPLVNGKEAFKDVYRAIDAAEKSVCIICWGFQPSMYFIRDGASPKLGDLLIAKAIQKGVVVRVLCWSCRVLGDVPVTGIVPGESNHPGRTIPYFYGDKPKTATHSQYLYDLWWYKNFDRQRDSTIPARRITQEAEKLAVRFSNKDLHKARQNLQFYSRSYSPADSVKLSMTEFLDKELPLTSKAIMSFTPSHHQKMVLVDHEDPKLALGFVMGHNMLDGYWDSSEHSGKQMPADVGRNGSYPLHDYSSRVTGPIVGDLFHNFAHAWKMETGESLPAPSFQNYPLWGNDTKTVCQILRTQPQTENATKDIAKCYLQAVSNASQCIVIENQYFRWQPLAEAITQAASKMTAWGRNPEKHGYLYLFVISNTSDDGMGAGSFNTYRMLDALGRADRIPEVTRIQQGEALDREIKAVERDLKAADKELKSALSKRAAIDRDARLLTGIPGARVNDRYGPINEEIARIEARKAQLEARKRELEARKNRLQPPPESKRKAETITPREVPGLKVHIATLVAPDTAPGKPWQEVYIHAKLMMIDDTFMTAGSANINSRSMQTDSELNIMHDRPEITKPLREQQWDTYTRGGGEANVRPGTSLKDAYIKWGDLMDDNAKAKKDMQSPKAQLHEFLRPSADISYKD